MNNSAAAIKDFRYDKTLRNHLVLMWAFFMLISFSLGYHTINSFIIESIPKNADAYVYKNIVMHGFSVVGDDHRSSRILLPLIARGIYLILPAKLGSWDVSLFSLLIVNVLLCSSIAILIYTISLRLRLHAQVAFIAALLFFLNFAVPNYYLASLVDAGECFCMMLLVLSLISNRWSYLPFIAIIGVSTKETFFPVATIFALVWALMEYKEKGTISLRTILYFCSFVITSFMMIVLLKSVAYGQLTFPWQYAERLYNVYHSISVSRIADGTRSFLYVFMWLLLLGIPRINQLPRAWVFRRSSERCRYASDEYLGGHEWCGNIQISL